MISAKIRIIKGLLRSEGVCPLSTPSKLKIWSVLITAYGLTPDTGSQNSHSGVTKIQVALWIIWKVRPLPHVITFYLHFKKFIIHHLRRLTKQSHFISKVFVAANAEFKNHINKSKKDLPVELKMSKATDGNKGKISTMHYLDSN